MEHTADSRSNPNNADQDMGYEFDLSPAMAEHPRLSNSEKLALFAVAKLAKENAPAGLEFARMETAVLEKYDQLLEVRGDIDGWPL